MGNMGTKYHKKKQPEVVRANLLHAAAQLVCERGFAGITLDLVAQKAGVSKGGLIHHFASRHILLEELCRGVLGEYEKNIDDFMAEDPEPKGRFIRAYIRSALKRSKTYDYVKLFHAYALELGNYPCLAGIYDDWFQRQLFKHGSDPPSLKAKMLMYAIDGLWVEECTEICTSSPEEHEAFINYLIEQTYEA